MHFGCSDVRHYDEPVFGERELLIYGTTDPAVFQPTIDDFQSQFANITVVYVDLEATPLYERFLSEAKSNSPSADILLSSAMDLQVKLVNDGFALPHKSDNAQDVPRWANWRNEAFGVTFEPAVMVFNRDLMQGRAIPRSRQAFLKDLRDNGNFWAAKIGTYDVTSSGVGYLLASQDARNGDDFGALVEALRDSRYRKYNTTSEILDAIVEGEVVAGYNLLGSYANIHADNFPNIEIVYPEDYTLAVSRTVIIPKNAKNADVAHIFLEYLLSRRGQKVLTEQSRLTAVRPEVAETIGALVREGNGQGQLRPISLGPGLLVYLDEQKKARFAELWGSPSKDRDSPASNHDVSTVTAN